MPTNINAFKDIRTMIAQMGTTTALRRLSPYNMSNKAVQNQILGENIVRKALQFVEDLESIQKKTSAYIAFSQNKPPPTRGNILNTRV